MMQLDTFSWETFTRTGDIEAYLLYRSTMEVKDKNVPEPMKEEQWQTLK